MKENRQPESPSLKKVVFLLNSSDWHGSNSETLWAAPMGSNLYRLENTPFFALDVSYQDVVLACEEKDGVAQFVQVFSRGGHSISGATKIEPEQAASHGWLPPEQIH